MWNLNYVFILVKFLFGTVWNYTMLYNLVVPLFTSVVWCSPISCFSTHNIRGLLQKQLQYHGRHIHIHMYILGIQTTLLMGYKFQNVTGALL